MGKDEIKEIFNRQLREIERLGYKDTEGEIQCPMSGGDHSAVIWEDSKGDQKTVCYICPGIS